MATDDPMFLRFNAFETTAFFTSLMVALYSLIPNPTGRQGPTDRSELLVYAGWRDAVLVIGAHLTFMAIVLGVLLGSDASGKSIAWVLLLMAAPWAPLAGSVKRTLGSWRRVRSMMLARTARNQMAAIAREYFLTGQRGIAAARIVYHVTGALPVTPLEALQDVPALATHVDAIRRAATPPGVAPAGSGKAPAGGRAEGARAAEAGKLLDMGILWAVHQGPQPWDARRRRLSLSAMAAAMDPLARLWTRETVPLLVSPFPAYQDAAGVPRRMPLRQQAELLDMMDELQTAGTLSDSLAARSLRGRFCDRCALATRGAVEAYLESDVRGHGDMRADAWLRNVNFQWHGHYEAMVDVLWEATFMDGAATRLSVSEQPDASSHYNDRAKVLTVRMLTLLFLVLRSVAGDAPPLAALADRVGARLHTRAHWADFWAALARQVAAEAGGPPTAGTTVATGRIGTATFKKVTRQVQDAEMEAVVDTLAAHPLEGALCGVPSCWLATDTTMRVWRVPPL